MQQGLLLAGKYRLLRKIGQGAMGEVWAALHERTERHVAVKFVTSTSRDHRERLLREARVLGRIQQRNVTDVVDLGETQDGAPFLVMEFLTGETLEQRIKRAGALAPTEAAALAADIARGLSAAHAVGVVHRDLKPANIFLHHSADRTVTVKVLDFGVSKLLTEESTATMTGMAIGSPAYMSPEQARGEKNLDARSDLWALGVVVYEMTAGQRPFQGDSSFDTVAEILRGPIPLLSTAVPHAPADLNDFVARCLQRNKTERLASADEAVAWLSAVAQGQPVVPGQPLRRTSFLTENAPSVPVPPPSLASGPVNTMAPAVNTQPSFAPRRPWKLIVAAVGGFAVVGLVASMAFRTRDGTSPASMPSSAASAPSTTAPAPSASESTDAGSAGASNQAHGGAGGTGGSGGTGGGGAGGNGNTSTKPHALGTVVPRNPFK